MAEGEGFVTRFWKAGPLTRPEHRPTRGNLPEWLEADRDVVWRTFEQSGPLVELAGRHLVKRGRLPSVYVLRADLYSADEQDAVVRASATGKMDLFVDGRSVLSTSDDRPILVDDHRTVVHLRRGLNRVALRIEQIPPRAVRLALRLQDTHNRPLRSVAWSLEAKRNRLAKADVCQLLDAKLEQVLAPDGFRVEAMIRNHGLRPAGRRARGRVLSLKVRGHEVEVHKTAAWSTLGGDGQVLDLALPPKEAGMSSVELRVDGQVCAVRHVRHRGELQRRLVASLGHREALPATLPEGTLASLEHHGDLVRELLETNDPDTPYIRRMLVEFEGLVEVAETGADPYLTHTGIVTRAYRSKMDGSLQHYVMWVPPSYAKKPDKTFPAVLTFHGLNGSPDEMLRITAGIERPEGMSRQAFARKRVRIRKWGQIIVAPRGYGNVGQRQLGELDVLRVLDEVLAAYRIDPSAVSMTGASLGGTVSFVVPLHNPDRFAAAAPLCGYPNIRTYSRVKDKPHTPWEEVLLEDKAIANYAENALHLPMRMVHGERDTPERSEVVVDRLKALGYKVVFNVRKGAGHNVWDYGYGKGRVLNWLSWRRIPDRPKHARLRTGQLRTNRAFWLRVDRFEQETEFGELDGRQTQDKVVVETSNVAAFSLLGAQLRAKAGAEVAVVIDGQPATWVQAAAEVSFTKRGGQWRSTDDPDVPAGSKRAGVSGPLDDIWFEPFTIIYGTADPDQVAINRRVAEHMSRYNTRSDISMPVMADTDVTEATLVGRGIVLIGNPKSNRITARAVAKLPVSFDDDGLSLGDRRFEGPEVGVSMIYPSPFDPDHYVVIHAGVTGEGTLSARYLPELVPDYLVYDSRIRAGIWGPILDPRQVLAGGFFGPMWEP